ncbi:MAG: trans-2-enoyl-CoA reductase family protein [Candidatus Obscuribacterales bacterium]|jgi:enoyl-[acyl-carrier protein] reductase/trans-2-enoyl-CoA reductase (NAD+)|nr:trans-2-enoyl-CoA reductase family protein [Candidatus Obscuribacterales bacterium]
MIIKPRVRGFICVTTHPLGCAENVREQIEYVKKQPITDGPKKVLVIGASTGYGLASRIAAAFGSNADTIGVFFEKPAEAEKPGTAGWYNTAEFEKQAKAAGLYAKSINGDAFSDEIRQFTVDLVKKDLGKVDLVIYSLASPKRKNPKDGVVYDSTLKPIGQPFKAKTLNTDKEMVTEIEIQPANETEIANTVEVMGGDDWELWMDALLKADVLAEGVKTVAYSYIGPEITWAIYRNGTIGKAKEDLENRAKKIGDMLSGIKGSALVSVNKAVVTQASSAIPVVPLYISLLFKVMKEKGTHEGCIEQIQRLFAKHLYNGNKPQTDEAGRVRMDDWEMEPATQKAVMDLWPTVTTENLKEISDYASYKAEFLKLFGFGLEKVDYEADVNPLVQIDIANAPASVK